MTTLFSYKSRIAKWIRLFSIFKALTIFDGTQPLDYKSVLLPERTLLLNRPIKRRVKIKLHGLIVGLIIKFIYCERKHCICRWDDDPSRT